MSVSQGYQELLDTPVVNTLVLRLKAVESFLETSQHLRK